MQLAWFRSHTWERDRTVRSSFQHLAVQKEFTPYRTRQSQHALGRYLPACSPPARSVKALEKEEAPTKRTVEFFEI